MEKTSRARVFMRGMDQFVEIPEKFRFGTKEVLVRCDSKTGDLILSQPVRDWEEIFADLDRAGIPKGLP